MVDLLQLSSHLPEVDIDSGQEILHEGEQARGDLDSRIR